MLFRIASRRLECARVKAAGVHMFPVRGNHETSELAIIVGGGEVTAGRCAGCGCQCPVLGLGC